MKGRGTIANVPLNGFSKAKIAATENELKEERATVGDLLRNKHRMAGLDISP